MTRVDSWAWTVVGLAGLCALTILAIIAAWLLDRTARRPRRPEPQHIPRHRPGTVVHRDPDLYNAHAHHLDEGTEPITPVRVDAVTGELVSVYVHPEPDNRPMYPGYFTPVESPANRPVFSEVDA